MDRITQFVLLGAAIIFAASCSDMTKEMKKKEDHAFLPFDPGNMDTMVNPGDNFFKFVNGNWIKNNPIPEKYSMYGNPQILLEQNNLDVLEILKDAAKDSMAAAGSNKKKIGDFFNSGMDTVAIDKARYSPIADEFKKIQDISSKEQLIQNMAELQLMGINTGFGFYVAQDEKESENVILNLYPGGLSLPDRDYYIESDDRSLQIMTEFTIHLEKMFVLIDEKQEDAKKFAEDVIEIEKQLAQKMLSRVEMRNPLKTYNKLDINQLKSISGNISWDDYFSTLGIDSITYVNCAQPDFMTEISNMFDQKSLDQWKTYLKWHLLNGTASFLSSDIESEDFHFNSTVIEGITKMKPRTESVVTMTNMALGEAVGELYVEKYFPAEAKTRMEELVSNLKEAFKSRINNLTWMGDSTKAEAILKLEAMNTKIGYPDKWTDYSSLEISKDSYARNMLNASKFQTQKNLAKLNKPVDRDEWFLTPQTINAYYHPTLNEIVFPAAILQPPFFNINADDAVNYGAIGAVIGHEMTHGFDDQGRNFNKDGNLIGWWTSDDEERFKTQIQPLIKEYDNYVMLDSLHINGQLTIGENIADLGGLTIAYDAYLRSFENKPAPDPIDGFTNKQRFFLSFAQVWRSNIRDEALANRLKTDVHSPAEARVNGIVYNMTAFYEAFPIDTNSVFYKSDNERIFIW